MQEMYNTHGETTATATSVDVTPRPATVVVDLIGRLAAKLATLPPAPHYVLTILPANRLRNDSLCHLCHTQTQGAPSPGCVKPHTLAW